MKALEKDRNRRYETANDFAADVERYLNDEAVEARHPSAAYTFRKFARRNRTVLTTVTLFAAALLLGTVVSVWLAAREFAARSQLETQHEELQQQKDETDRARGHSEDLRYVSDMNRAEQARRDRDWRLVRQLLKAHHPSADGVDRRGWEWYYLWHACWDTVPTIRHDHIVRTMAILPGDTTLVTGDVTGELIVWDLANHTQLSTQKAHEDQVLDVEFSPTNSMLVSSGYDNYIRLWRIDPATNSLIDEGFLEEEHSVLNWRRVASSHDGKYVATGGTEGKIRLWDLSTRKPVIEIPNQTAFTLALDPKGRALAAHTGADVIIWSLPYDRDKAPWVIPDYDNIGWIGFGFSPDGRLLAACSGTTMDLWSLADQELVHRLPPRRPLSVAFFPNSRKIAVGEADKTISIWDTTSGEMLHELVGHSGGICCVRVSPDGKTLASSSFDGTVRLWPLNHDRAPDQPPDVLTHHSKPVQAMSFSPDGRWLATGERWSRTPERKIVLWDTTTWLVAKEFYGAVGVFSHDSRILAVAGGRTSGVRLWDLHTHQNLPPLPYAGGFDVELAFSSDGKLAVFGGKKRGQLWEPYERKVVAEATRSMCHIGFSPDGQRLAATSLGGDVALFNPKTLGLLRHRPEALEVYGTNIAFMPNSHYFATPDYDHTVKVWDVRGGKLELYQTLGNHTDSALCAAFSPNGVLAVGCANGSVRLWDSSTWEERATLKCHDIAVCAVCFSPDGKTLVTGSEDTTVRIHRAATTEQVIEAEERGVDPLRIR
jgi:WD40 repeat protein